MIKRVWLYLQLHYSDLAAADCTWDMRLSENAADYVHSYDPRDEDKIYVVAAYTSSSPPLR